MGQKMSAYTSFRIGGPADLVLIVRSVEEAETVVRWTLKEKVHLTVLGAGSNVLVSDKGVDGAVMILAPGPDPESSPMDGETVGLKVWAGSANHALVSMAKKQGLLDLAFLAGIPGSIGGATVMNAGTKLGAMEQAVRSITMIDGQGRLQIIDRAELNFSYRRLLTPIKGVIVEVELISRLGRPEEISRLIDGWLAQRRASQPGGQASAGSFFKNPPQDFAARLIDQAGLKGASRGDAEVSRKHANFIVNRGRAKAEEVISLADAVRETVARRFGVYLEPEIKFIGRGRETWPTWAA